MRSIRVHQRTKQRKLLRLNPINRKHMLKWLMWGATIRKKNCVCVWVFFFLVGDNLCQFIQQAADFRIRMIFMSRHKIQIDNIFAQLYALSIFYCAPISFNNWDTLQCINEILRNLKYETMESIVFVSSCSTFFVGIFNRNRMRFAHSTKPCIV